ncbi:hypothetical protein P775_01955 [Puniceibacterium antarcticum]|uniref:Uncharacterized protein n=1 Tax=Puniceibacterium antarcticum TaxID=1206336 RepID=A0A2G8RKI1_9RHOB|nr:hypothetical protein P775_01955 [Puniceibacterium antarcticum]
MLLIALLLEIAMPEQELLTAFVALVQVFSGLTPFSPDAAEVGTHPEV